jgi:hypothetical protein
MFVPNDHVSYYSNSDFSLLIILRDRIHTDTISWRGFVYTKNNTENAIGVESSNIVVQVERQSIHRYLTPTDP